MSLDSARRQRALAHAAGAQFEGWLEVHHREAVALGLLSWWRHISPRVKWVGLGARARAVVVGEACADYVGQTCSGRSLVIEAKSTGDVRFRRGAIEPQQLAHLDACAAHDGLAILAIEFRAQDGDALRIVGRFAVPWRLVPWRKLRSAESISAADLAGFEATGRCYLLDVFKRGAA
jgi:hypothetical protein